MRTLWHILPYSCGYNCGWRMYSSTLSLDSSLVLKEPGSSRTSPSRLPRMFVENQPSSPSMRALKPGARMVFISVWPVLKSFPQMATPWSCASVWIAGISTVRLGAPLAKGTPLVTEAQAYSIEGAIAGWLDCIASMNFSGVECTSSGLTKDSVEPHQHVTRREARKVLRKLAMSSLICSASSYLFLPFLMFGPSINFTKSWSNAAFMGLMVERKGFTFSRSCGFRTPAFAADW